MSIAFVRFCFSLQRSDMCYPRDMALLQERTYFEWPIAINILLLWSKCTNSHDTSNNRKD